MPQSVKIPVPPKNSPNGHFEADPEETTVYGAVPKLMPSSPYSREKQRMAVKRTVSVSAMVLILAVFLGLHYATAVEARPMLHPCFVGEGEEVNEGPRHDQDCGVHTPTPASTNTPTSSPTNTPTATNTPTRTPTNTPTNTRRPPNPPTHGPANTPTPTYTPQPTSTPIQRLESTPTNTPSPAPPTYTPRPGPTSTPRPASFRLQEPCVVAHAATPAQLCLTAEGIEYYFIGPGGVEPGPFLPSISELAEIHPAVPPVVALYRGANPLTGKPVRIDYLPSENVIRVSTFYADTPYSMNKPYVFTLNQSHQVTYQAW